MNFGIVEQEDIVIFIIVQECYNSHFPTCLPHPNPSNKIEYVRSQQEPPRIKLMAYLLSSFIVL